MEQEREERGEQTHARVKKQRSEGCLAGKVGEEVDDGGVDGWRQRKHQVIHKHLDYLDGVAEDGVERKRLREQR